MQLLGKKQKEDQDHPRGHAQEALTTLSDEPTTTTLLMTLLLLDGELHEIWDNILFISVCMTPGAESSTEEALGNICSLTE